MKKTIYIIILFLLLILSGCRRNEQIVIYGPDEVVVGESINLLVNINTKVIWSTEDESIATVDNDGNVTGISPGRVILTVRKANDYEVSETIEIRVILSPGEVAYFKSKILSIDEENNYIEFLNVPFTEYTSDTEFIQIIEDELYDISIEDLYVGMENIYVAIDFEADIIERVIVDGEPGFANIRVAIRRSIDDIADESTLYHDSVSLTLNSNTVIHTFDGEESMIITGGTLNITVSNNKLRVKNASFPAFETNKRLILSPNTSIKINSITRSFGNPTYEGNLEIVLVDSKLLIINDVNIENYLTKVVPAEMSSSFHAEALRAQAIAARTYAYREIFNKTNDKLGFAVDDSVNSQVYNNLNANNKTSEAIVATNGLVMSAGGMPIQIYYYSTSPGLTASAHEVWFEGIDEVAPISGLIGQNLTTDYETGEKIVVDPQDEASMLEFFKTIKVKTPDVGSPYHRWKIGFTTAELKKTLSKNMIITYANTPQSLLTLENGEWIAKEIPNDIGKVENIYVSERGESGVVMSIVIETDIAKYKIFNQYNIRFTIRPKDAGTNVFLETATNIDTDYDKPTRGESILRSGFFAITKENDKFIFYGGGNGHGVGMSQYGAHGLGINGLNYEEILTTYYSNMTLTDISYSYTVRDDIEEILQDLETDAF